MRHHPSSSVLPASAFILHPSSSFLLLASALLCGACTHYPPGLCDTEADCTPGLLCSNGVCVGCTSAEECGSGNTCTPDHLCAPAGGGGPDAGVPDGGEELVVDEPPIDWMNWPPLEDDILDSNYFPGAAPGTVEDASTGLVWRLDVSADRTWADAVAYCAALDAPEGGWRLPSYVELESLVDYTRSEPAINGTVFVQTPALRFWSSTAVAGAASGSAYYVDFSNGYGASQSKDSTGAVRCAKREGGGE